MAEISETVVCSVRELRDAIAGLSVTVRDDRTGQMLSNSELAQLIHGALILNREEKLREHYRPIPGQEPLFSEQELGTLPGS